MRAAIVNRSIDPPGLLAEVARDANGATAMFLGTVRSTNEGREVTGIEYSSYDQMAVREMTSILREAGNRFGLEHGVIEHRVGRLSIGEVSIAVAVATPHRAVAFDALEFIVDETKRRAPVWKLELYVDGTREWVGAGSGMAQ